MNYNTEPDGHAYIQQENHVIVFSYTIIELK